MNDSHGHVFTAQSAHACECVTTRQPASQPDATDDDDPTHHPVMRCSRNGLPSGFPHRTEPRHDSTARHDPRTTTTATAAAHRKPADARKLRRPQRCATRSAARASTAASYERRSASTLALHDTRTVIYEHFAPRGGNCDGWRRRHVDSEQDPPPGVCGALILRTAGVKAGAGRFPGAGVSAASLRAPRPPPLDRASDPGMAGVLPRKEYIMTWPL
jgi:hypothetical protein